MYEWRLTTAPADLLLLLAPRAGTGERGGAVDHTGAGATKAALRSSDLDVLGEEAAVSDTD